MYKLVQNKEFIEYRQVQIGLATNNITFAKLIKTQGKYSSSKTSIVGSFPTKVKPEGFSKWEKSTLKGTLYLKDFLESFTKEHNVNVGTILGKISGQKDKIIYLDGDEVED